MLWGSLYYAKELVRYGDMKVRIRYQFYYGPWEVYELSIKTRPYYKETQGKYVCTIDPKRGISHKD